MVQAAPRAALLALNAGYAQSLGFLRATASDASWVATLPYLGGPPPTKHLAITGGTGIYRNAGGEATLVEFGPATGRLTLYILRFSPGG